jgi:valyl-tRNA synthetase
VLEARSIVTAPLPVARGLSFTDLATVVAADALVRRAWALGRGAELVVPTLAGDLGGQHAFDVQLAREGQDRSSLRPDQVVPRRAAFEEDRRLAAAEQFAALAVTADLGAVTTAGRRVARAARTAFVRLFEEGVVEETEHVVATCPRCRTVVDGVDTSPSELEGERLRIELPTTDDRFVELTLVAPELLPGAVAVAVPEGSSLAGATVVVPIADREVPVVADPLHSEPALVVPAHDGDAHALARAHGFVPVAVLDGDGAVSAAGPLHGLGRYAARAAARGLLEAEGVLLSADSAPEEVWRCGCCSTVLVPQLGRNWFLRAADLEVAAADAVRNGLVEFSPPDARDAFLGRAGVRRDWCLSTNVDSGVPVPASLCLDCGKVTVDVDPASSCGKCMGVLVPQPLGLDARFVAAVWAVTNSGWPGRRPSTGPAETVVVVSGTDLAGWVLPAVALGLRLAGTAPFAGVVVHPWPEAAAGSVPPVASSGASSTSATSTSSTTSPSTISTPAGELDLSGDRRVLRLVLASGVPDAAPAEAAVAALDRPLGEDELDGAEALEAAEAAAAGIAALDDGAPAQAAGLLASALSAGVPAEAAARVRALALPILGD